MSHKFSSNLLTSVMDFVVALVMLGFFPVFPEEMIIHHGIKKLSWFWKSEYISEGQWCFLGTKLAIPMILRMLFEIIINFLLHVVKTIKSLRFLKFHYLWLDSKILLLDWPTQIPFQRKFWSKTNTNLGGQVDTNISYPHV